MDLSKLQSIVAKEVEEEKANYGKDYSSYPIVYPGENGKLTVRLLYCEKFSGVQRKLVRHTTEKQKVPCMQMYGEDCPICKAVSNAETLKGKESGVFKKYGWKVRGICYAVIDSYDPVYFKGKDDPKRGDIVVLMYPKMVYNEINNILLNAGEHLDNLLAYNTGSPIVIERSQKQSNQPPQYKVSVYPYGTSKIFEDDKTWEETLASLPNLGDELIPALPTEEMREKVRAFTDTVNQEYIKDAVVNPTPETSSTRTVSQPATSGVTTQETKCDQCAPGKDCFGHHVEDKNECLTCLEEDLCIKATKGTA